MLSLYALAYFVRAYPPGSEQWWVPPTAVLLAVLTLLEFLLEMAAVLMFVMKRGRR